VPRGTTTVRTAESEVKSTIRMPATRQITASSVVSSVGSSPSPGGRVVR